MTNELLITAPIPAFLNKSPAWFRKNWKRIQRGKTQNPLWRRAAFEISRSWPGGMRTLVEKLVEMGYLIAPWPEHKGECTLRGGTVIISPINEIGLWRIDFLGNAIESIQKFTGENLEIRASRKLFEYLRDGDYVVHENHGIGIWRGVKKERGRKYFHIEYRGPRDASPDSLLVPIEEDERIAPYIGFRAPPITRLGTPLWKRIIKHTKEEALGFAKKLLELQASRELAHRLPYPAFPELEDKLAAGFPHQETVSQKKVLAEIMTDLEGEAPMDRILMGDVGFGKTEVALRASARVAASGAQVAVLAPTTLLSDQHYHTWKDRLRDFPFQVERLSRLETVAKERRVLEAIQKGTADIIVGTHRLLSRDVVWKNLGLVIIDEEQRFGVRAKEYLKDLKKTVDVLTLSATPLPRTLSMALASIKKMSVLEEAPLGRKAPSTFVLPYKKEIVRRALEAELKRGGQIYFLEGRIRTIPKTLEFLKELLPARTIGYIHGRLPEKKLIETMEKFRAGKIEVLISTTIIENGIDLSEVNTLIVSDATIFGLSDLHQLRGRVGRGKKEAFAYFLYNPEHLGEGAKKRLDVISSTQFLGAGAVIAEKDLEMRGAGNILGREQSGAARRVGLNLYSQFLAEAIENIRTEK